LQEACVVVGNNKADDSKGHNVEKRDTPEDLLDGGRKRFPGVGSFRCCKTDQFSAREGKGCVDKDTAEALEAMVEGSRIAPEFTANVATFWTASDIDYNTQDDETDDGGNLDDGKDELGFTITFDTVEC
jgi:hypothetical protein